MLRIIFISLALLGCGGGGSSETIKEDVVTEPVKDAVFYDYSLTFNGTAYEGRGVRNEDVIYFFPKIIADSERVVIADMKISNNVVTDINIYSYINRGLLFSLTDNNNYDLTLTEFEGSLASESDLDKKWFQTSSAGIFGDAIIEFNYDNENIVGSDNVGCIYNGSIKQSMINITVTNCEQSGEYKGALLYDQDKIMGAMTNGKNGIPFRYSLE